MGIAFDNICRLFGAFPAQKLNNLPDWIAHLLKLGDLSVLWMMLSGLDSFGLV
jgi:hypothetical protein